MATTWEYAVLRVEWAWFGEENYEFTATAWQNEDEIYKKVITSRYWSVPLGDMGRMGWELVGANDQNVLLQSWLKGYTGQISVPVVMMFFFKRPKED